MDRFAVMTAWCVGCACVLTQAAWGQAGGAGSPTIPPEAVKPDRQPARDVSPETGLVDLRPKFRKGQEIRYVLEQNSRNQVKGPDPKDDSLNQDQVLTQRIGLVMRVVDQADDGATIQVVYESIRMTMKTADEEATFDSAAPSSKPQRQPSAPAAPAGRPSKPGSPPPAKTPDAPDTTDPLDALGDLDMSAMLEKMVSPMVGTTLTIKTDRSGAITSVTGGESLGGSLGGLSGLGGGAGGQLMPSPKQTANWLVSGVAGTSGQVRVGQTWTNSDALSGTPVGGMQMSTTHTLRSHSGGSATVAFKGHVLPASEGAPATGGVQIQNAAYSGTYQWDTRAGQLREMATDMRVEISGGQSLLNLKMSSETQTRVRRQ